MRSVSVVFPASMCAAIPMFRVRSSGYGRSGLLGLEDMAGWGRNSPLTCLPAEVGEGAVGLGHLVHVVALADGGALVVGGVLQLVGQGHVHRGALAAAGVTDDPAQGQG